MIGFSRNYQGFRILYCSRRHHRAFTDLISLLNSDNNEVCLHNITSLFYQGFEDILILDELMDYYNSDFAKVLPRFSEIRCDDAHAICELAMYNYIEVYKSEW